MLKELINRMQKAVKNFRVWVLYQNYAQQASRSIQHEINESIEEAFAENVEVMNLFKERLIKLYNNDKRN